MSSRPRGSTLTVVAPDGVPEISAGDDLVALLLSRAELHDGDVVLVTSKVVSKAEGQVRASTRDAELAGETTRVVARRGRTTIVRTRLGLTMAAAGIDASNVTTGHVVLHPRDPDASARSLREALARRAGVNVGVLLTDTAGRAWREGQTDIAIGAAGVSVLESYAGEADQHGNPLVVTAPAVADELAAAAELASGKLGGRPFVVVRGRADLVLPTGEHGPGAAALIREEGADLFGLGAREAVLLALAGDPADRAPFGAPAEPAEFRAAVHAVTGLAAYVDQGGPTPAVVVTGGTDPRLAPLAFAFGWEPVSATRPRFHPRTP